MKLYNTLSRTVEEFRPIDPGVVKLYTCGPTVYDYAHLGNLRSFVFDDTLRRNLEASGYRVKHVMNITDVGHLTSDMDEGEDKLESGAAREHKTVWEVAESYVDAFEKDAAALNILPPNGYSGPHQPYARATDFIDGQVAIVQTLLEKGYAYPTEQAIYFDVTKLADYGRLTHQNLSDKEVAARPDVVTDTDKRHPQDFALWFFNVGRFAKHSMAWDSPWGKGFPGWHLECSAIIHATLKEPLDIHTGGVDHIGTHHTNEMAQTEAAFGVQLANYWLHNEYLLADGQKMSKSKGNFYTLKDVTDKGFDPLALRLLFLQAHYRSQMNFTFAALEASQNFLKSLQAWADTAKQPNVPSIEPTAADRLENEIKAALADDLNSARALAQINEFTEKVSPTPELLRAVDSMLGLGLSSRPDIGDEIKSLLSERQKARENQDWELSDRLRQDLLDKGVEVKDAPAGQIWHRA